MGVAPALSTFIGRTAELERVSKLFADGARLVTIFGTGGIGKTRFATRYADVEGTGDVVFCDLSAATSLRDVCAVVASSLSVDLGLAVDDEGLLERLRQAISARGPALLLFDNCESTTADIARALRAWLPGSTARFLLTSRELLRAEGEVAFELGSLDLPNGADVLDSDAVRLFVDRLRMVRPGYVPAAGELESLGGLVRRLDGIPLAIELAAARGDVLGPADILDRLGRALDVLSSPARQAVDRQRTMSATIEWSWRTLSEDEAAALARMSVFRGSFSVEACEAVLEGERTRPLDLLQALRAKSLLRTFTVGSPGRMRFALYEMVRQFAAKTMSAEAAHQARERHLAWSRNLALAVVDAPARAPITPKPLLDLDVENLQAALDHAIENAPRHAESALAIAVALEKPLRSRGDITAVLAALSSALSTATSKESPRLRALAHVTRARSARAVGRWEQHRGDVAAALSAADEAHDDHALGRALVERAMGEALTGSAEEAFSAFDEALVHFRRCPEESVAAEADALALRAYVEMAKGVGDPRGHLERSIELSRAAGDVTLESLATDYLAYFYFSKGDLDGALRCLERTKVLVEQSGDDMRRAGRDYCAGRVLQELGRWEEAEAAYDAAIAFFRRALFVGMVAQALAYSGTLLHERGDLKGALARYEEAIPLFEQTQVAPLLVLFRGFVAAARAVLGASADAERVFASLEADPLGQALAAPLGVLRGQIDLAEARAATAAGNDALAAENLARAKARLHAPLAGEPDDDVRLARRLLERGLAKVSVVASEPSSTVLAIGPDGAWFRIGASPAVDLGRRRQLQRLLLVLARAHAAGPGTPVAVAELFRAAWPEERALREAVENRVRVAVTTLRNLGLRDFLNTHAGAYALSATLSVVEGAGPGRGVASQTS